MSFFGCSMVVRSMRGSAVEGMLSKPMRERSSGMRMWSSSAAFRMPSALESVEAKMAV